MPLRALGLGSARPAGGVHYIVCERIEGATLQRMIETKDFELTVPANVIAIVTGLLRGLAAVHGAGFIHRDIKPENIFVCADFSIRVGDFGQVHGMRQK